MCLVDFGPSNLYKTAILKLSVKESMCMLFGDRVLDFLPYLFSIHSLAKWILSNWFFSTLYLSQIKLYMQKSILCLVWHNYWRLIPKNLMILICAGIKLNDPDLCRQKEFVSNYRYFDPPTFRWVDVTSFL